MTDKTKEKEKIKFNIVSANWKAQQEWGMAYNTSTTSQAFIENRSTTTALRKPMTDTTSQEIRTNLYEMGYKIDFWYDNNKLDAICVAKWIGEDLVHQKTYKVDDIADIIFNDFLAKMDYPMTDTQKILEEFDKEFMQPDNYPWMRTDVTGNEIKKFLITKIQEAVAEERERILAAIRKRCRLPIGDVVEFIDELEELAKKD